MKGMTAAFREHCTRSMTAGEQRKYDKLRDDPLAERDFLLLLAFKGGAAWAKQLTGKGHG